MFNNTTLETDTDTHTIISIIRGIVVTRLRRYVDNNKYFADDTFDFMRVLN